MNILTDGFPETVCIDGAAYAVNTDYRAWISIGSILEDSGISLPEKAQKILFLGYQDKIPPSFSKAMEGIFWFYTCGRTEKTEHKPSKKTARRQVFSFSEDDALIYAAFWKEYGINLAKENLHWWQFWSLLAALGEDTRLMQVIGYRSAELSKINDKNRKRFYRQMQALYRLPDRRSAAEREEDFTRQLGELFEEG